MKNNSLRSPDDQSTSVANLSLMINKVLKVLKKWDHTLKKRASLRPSHSLKANTDVRKTISKSIDKDDPYSHSFINHAKNRKTNDTQHNASSDRIQKNWGLMADLTKEAKQSPLPLLNSKNEMKIDNVYSTHYDLLNRSKYKKTMSHKRSMNFNDNLAKLIKENIKKENELEKIEKLNRKLQQVKQSNELLQQIKEAHDLKKMNYQSNMKMDEDYIQVYVLFSFA